VLGIVGLLVLSAFFSGSETALTSLSSSKARQLVEEGGHPWLQLWLDRPIPVLTTILIGNNIVNVAASALATDVAHRALDGTPQENWAIPAAIGIMTFLLLTFGEITPKAVSKRMFVTVSSFAIRVLRPFYFVFSPFTKMFVRFTQVIMRTLGNNPDERSPYVTYEEIEYLIALGSREGTFSEDKERLLRSVVEFPETLVKEIMVPRTEMVALPAEISLDELLDTLARCGHSRLPVYGASIDDIVGMFYAKDLIHILSHRAEADDFDISRHLRPSYFVPESKRIADLLTEFQGNRIHIAIVVDEFGGTAGIITLEDIIEEIFGDIQDEYDAEPEQLLELNPDLIRADARVPIEDVEDYFAIDFPDEPDFESLAGFILAQMGSVPAAGDEFRWKNLHFRILKADEKKIISVEVERLSEAYEEPPSAEEDSEEPPESLDQAVG
jgi:CBS domain containing-hemolysin-like protein